MNEIESFVRSAVDGSVDPAQLESAADRHVSTMAPQDVAAQLQTAATNAQQNGRPDFAEQLQAIVQQHGVSSESLKDAAVAYVKDNPDVLAHFAPSFAQGIIAKAL